MRTVSFTEFRKRASELLGQVERGETLLVLRHGKPIAEISPASSSDQAAARSWQRPGLRLATRGADLSTAILQERRHEGVL